MGDDWEDDDWEADGIDEKLKLPQGKDEEWSDEEGHEAHLKPDPAELTKNQPTAPKPKKEKSEFEKKLEARELREAEEAARKAEMRQQMASASVADDDDEGGELDDANLERVRQQKLQKELALDAALDTFGLSAPTGKPPPPKPKAAAAPKKAPPVDMALSSAEVNKAAEGRGDAKLNAAGTIEAFKAAKDAEFEMLGAMINKKLTEYEGTKGHLVCLKALLKASTSNMSPDDTKELSTFLSVVYNDKLKAEREKDKKKAGGKKKGKLNISAGKMQDGDGMGGDEYDDPFM